MSIEEDVVTQAGPATKRGQYLLSADLLNLLSGPWTPFRQEQFGLTILAIEQEAADLERRRVKPLQTALERFVKWGGLWLFEKERREAHFITPGAMPDPSFAEKPARLNDLLAQLTVEGRVILDALASESEPQ